MKKILLPSLIAFCCQTTNAQKNADINQFYPVDKGHSYIEFSIKYMGYAKVKGRFAEFSGMFRYDPSNLSNTSVTLSIKTKSIDTDLDFRDNDLRSENWFDAEKFPTMFFQSKKISKTNSGFDLTGDLTIKDVTKEVVIQMDPPSGVLKDVRSDAQVIFTGQTSVDRTQFGVEGKKWSGIKEGITAVENVVNIEFSILGKQLKVSNFSNWIKNERPAGKLYKLAKEQGIDACLSEFQKMKDDNVAVEDGLLIAGRMLLLEGNVDDAIVLLEANKNSSLNSSNAIYMLGEAYATKGDWARAKELFEQALKIDPNNLQAIEVLRHL